MEKENNNKFAIAIETLVCDYDVNYIDAVTIYCEKNNIEIESVVPILMQDKVLLAKIRENAEQLRILKTEGAKLQI